MVTSTGCPKKCKYCSVKRKEGKFRCKSIPRVLEELETIFATSYRGSLFIVDDNFIGNIRRTKELLIEVAEWQKSHGYPFKFLTQATIEIAYDDELMRYFTEAGGERVFVGMETISTTTLMECGKDQNAGKNILSAVEHCHSKGVHITPSLMYGFDGDNLETRNALLDLTLKLPTPFIMMNLLEVLPGTVFEEELAGVNPPRLLEKPFYRGGALSSFKLNFKRKEGDISAELVEEYFMDLVKSIHSRKNFYHRIHLFLKSFKKTTKGNEKILWNDILALLKSTYYIGILSKSRWYYWKMILELLSSRRKMKSSGNCIEFAVIGEEKFFAMADSLPKK